jgi:hypothetical protein
MNNGGGMKKTLIVDIQRLRNAVIGRYYNIGIWFARKVARRWKENRYEGIRAACWGLSQILKDVPGSYDLYAKARRLAIAEY